MVVNYKPYHRAIFINSSNRISGALYEKASGISQFFSLRDANQKLADENAFLKSRLPESFQLSPNYIRLVTDSLTTRQYVFRAARVINNSVNKQHNFLTLNRGSIDGIKKDMGVICSEGLVGVVNKTSPHYSTVISLLNARWKVSAKVKNTGYFGSIEWDGKSSQYVNLTEIPLHANVKPGDLIVSSNYSGTFQEGIPIGEVEEVELNEGDSFFTIRVKLSVDFKKLTFVEVIENKQLYEQQILEKITQDDW